MLGRMFLAHQGPKCRDVPDPNPGMSGKKLYAQRLFLLFRQGMPLAGMSRDLGLGHPPIWVSTWCSWRNLKEKSLRFTVLSLQKDSTTLASQSRNHLHSDAQRVRATLTRRARKCQNAAEEGADFRTRGISRILPLSANFQALSLVAFFVPRRGLFSAWSRWF